MPTPDSNDGGHSHAHRRRRGTVLLLPKGQQRRAKRHASEQSRRQLRRRQRSPQSSAPALADSRPTLLRLTPRQSALPKQTWWQPALLGQRRRRPRLRRRRCTSSSRSDAPEPDAAAAEAATADRGAGVAAAPMASADSKAGDAAIESQDSTAPDWMICPITKVSVATQFADLLPASLLPARVATPPWHCDCHSQCGQCN